MKKRFIISILVVAVNIISCQKNSSQETIKLTASTTTPVVGQSVNMQVTTGAKAVNWTINPTIASSKLYSITTQKSNVITFSQAGNYTVSVSARDIDLDTSINKNLDSCWHAHERQHGGCHKDIDSAAVTITVK